MKRLIISITFLTITALASCKKNPSDTCTTKCLNGGTISSTCGCNCPSGYTGSTCQTRIQAPVTYTDVIASLNPNTAHQICPEWYSGDDDYGGCLSIAWSVKLLITSNNTKIYAKIYADFKECSNTGSTKAWIDPDLASSQVLLYTAPAGQKISSINSPYNYGNTVYPSLNYHGTITLTNNDVNSYLNKIEMVGDTSGPDLPCDGSTGRSLYKVYFKSFGVTLINQ